MSSQKKPQTPEEIQSDIDKHPERGMLRGEDGELAEVVRFDTVDLNGSIPKELYRVLLEIWGAKGMTKTHGLIDMASQYVTHQGNLQLVKRSQQQKSELYGVTETEVRNRVFGAYKKRSRQFRARYEPGTEK